MSLRILHPGTFSLLVDSGRPGARSLGLPLGGAADRAAYRIGNALVGNTNPAVALEIALSGPTLVADRDHALCLFGASFAMQIDDRAVEAGSVVQLRANQTLKIASTTRGARAYLCVRGGFPAKTILDSGSALAPLKEGDDLICESLVEPGRSLGVADANSLLNEAPDAELHVIAGPQADWFSVERFYGQAFVVSPASNRMGIRLDGESLQRPSREMVSEAVAPGAVQITNDGLPIILGVDGQTIGGYPKLAHVIRADLDRIAQLRPGESIRFVRVELPEAEARAEQRQRTLRRGLTALRLARME